jgi:TAT (twin-arginine translocation) pathway signal sequence
VHRRNFIRTSIVTAGGMALAGCSEGDGTGLGGSGNGGTGPEFPAYDLPAYSAWPPAEPRTNDFVLFGHLNIQHLHEADTEGDSNVEEAPTAEDDEDVLLTLPGYGFMVTAFWFYFGLWSYPWQGTLGSEDEPDGMATDALTMTEGTFVFHGEYDAAVFAEEYAEGFEEREHNGFTVFEGQAGGETDQLVYAVSEDAVVATIAPEDVEDHEGAVGVLDTALTNRVDEVGRVVDDEDGQWLYETTGPADMVTGFWRVDGLDEEDMQTREGADNETDTDTPPIEENPVFNNVDSFISMLVLPDSEGGVGGDTAAARFAALYPEGEVPSEDDLREELLASDPDAELDITTTDNRVHVALEGSEDEIR